mgnify:FL=1
MIGHSDGLVRALLGSVVLSSCALTAGCVQPPKQMYQWGDYSRQVYQHMKADESTPDVQAKALEAHVERVRASGGVLPPGFRAHLGMIYLQLGRDGEAWGLFEAEKIAFPESAQYMEFLLKQKTNGKS